MRSKEFDGMVCSVAGVMGALGDRWGLLVMRDILLGLRRYDDFRQSSGITNATLTDRLKSLERNGLVDRRRYQTRPDRYEYIPSNKGRDIGLIVQAMIQVGDKWNVAARNGPPLRLVERQSGHATRLAVIDVKTGAEIAAGQLVPKIGPGADELMKWRVDTGRLP